MKSSFFLYNIRNENQKSKQIESETSDTEFSIVISGVKTASEDESEEYIRGY